MPLRPSHLALLAAASAGAVLLATQAPRAVAAPTAGAGACADVGLNLPPGFCATVFADGIGHARHMAVAADGTLYVNTWSGRYYRNSTPPPPSGFIVALRDADGDGKAETMARFGPTQAEGNAGGVGLALYRGGLYVETNDRIVRYALTPGHLAPTGGPATVLSEMPLTGDHPMHPFAIDPTGALYVNSGSPSNACEEHNRKPGSVGKSPCEELATRAGIWRYDAAKTDQHFSPAERFATGIRNAGGIAFDADGRIFATQHGRDQLSQNWPAFFKPERGPALPAEELLALSPGADYGWPTCYYDGFQHKLMLAPEYGGDGKTPGLCAGKVPPVAAFPAHWAPNDVLIYTGAQFPAAYRGGAFIAFHGSWNRAPAPQDGYNVTFQPLAAAEASGRSILFADGFAGGFKEPGKAVGRPAGLATGPDGALYIADDVRGRIWRVTYRGPANAALAGARPASVTNAAASDAPSSLPTPSGFSAEQVALGDRIYHGQARAGTCAGCHGSDARGTSVGPALVTTKWLWADGSVRSLATVITSGVPKPKAFSGAMPPKGGADLSPSDVDAVAAYVWALNQPASSR